MNSKAGPPEAALGALLLASGRRLDNSVLHRNLSAAFRVLGLAGQAAAHTLEASRLAVLSKAAAGASASPRAVMGA